MASADSIVEEMFAELLSVAELPSEVAHDAVALCRPTLCARVWRFWHLSWYAAAA